MKIEVWSDYVCPFCYIGKRKLEIALDQFEYKEEVKIEFKSFELDPYAPKKYDKNIHELIAEKYGMPVEQAKMSHKQLTEQAKSVGLTYNFDKMTPTNTLDAHRLFQYAKANGKGHEAEELILKAYFTDSLNISDLDVLGSIALQAGLDQEKTLTVLNSDLYKKEVREDEQLASKLNITGVPYFVFNDKYTVSGAQPSELFLELLRKVKSEEENI